MERRDVAMKANVITARALDDDRDLGSVEIDGADVVVSIRQI